MKIFLLKKNLSSRFSKRKHSSLTMNNRLILIFICCYFLIGVVLCDDQGSGGLIVVLLDRLAKAVADARDGLTQLINQISKGLEDVVAVSFFLKNLLQRKVSPRHACTNYIREFFFSATYHF
ncbi:uncharacterized protein [Parasteatoda tepidariorum]|uniref:uncharacterized protein n=1 Tax=Parasteatoda tepidariorum TaxID=114398 RepID=UPI0039BD70BA